MNTLLANLAKIIAPIIAKELLPLVPIIAAAVAKALFEQLKSGGLDFNVADLAQKGADSLLEADPDLPFVSDLFDLSEFLKKLRG